MIDVKKHNSPLRVVFAGTPEFAAISLQKLIENQSVLNIEIVAVYTQPDRKSGRGQKITASAVKQVALEHGISIEQPVSFSLKYNPEDGSSGKVSRETLAAYKPDVMIVAAYGLILPKGVLNIPKYGCLNIHASLLPRWRGAAPIQRAILAGDETTGVTIMQMNQGLDTGDMLYKMLCPITNGDTAQSLHDKLAELGAKAIITVMKDLSYYQSVAITQDDTQATYADKISSSDGQIDWQKDAVSINRQIRALSTYSYLNGERVKILNACLVNNSQKSNQAGQIISVDKNMILVSCGTFKDDSQSVIGLLNMQWPGGKPLNAEQINNSNKLNNNDIFETL